ncbi:MAG TPA: AAA family ATPase [bacterium]|nr:AAA family ATPase [bacterium]
MKQFNNSGSKKLICIVGMCGSGKSEVSQYLLKQHKFGYVRIGQAVMDEIIRRGEKPSEALEKEVREQLRKEHGMAVMAKLNLPKFKSLLQEKDVIGDGLYSWEEYKLLKDEFGENMVVIAVYAPPCVRYGRLQHRSDQHPDDEKLLYRNFTKEEALKRDYAEIENLNKGGPIAMADYTVQNLGNREELFAQLNQILTKIFQ